MHRATTKTGPKKKLLLAFDAFGTLFTPKTPIASQYGEVARRYKVAEGVSDNEIKKSFGKAFKEESKEHPNYGKKLTSNNRLKVITKTFRPFLLAADASLPSGLVPDLLTRFSTSEGYALYPDVLPLFSQLRQLNSASPPPDQQHHQHHWRWDHTIVGIITNSDDRIPGILSSFGLSVGPRRAGTADSSTEDASANATEEEDISFVVLSYDVGASKPDRAIFDAAKQIGTELFAKVDGADGEGFEMLYVGDEVEKDVLAAEDAGWGALLVDREERFRERFTDGRQMVTVAEGEREFSVMNDLSALSSWRSR
ncbi:hypothetical protein H2199_000421 [Coniosporium tulheliwenetii]|uniref:Uncharacterized protein n=1 Tax=Coniosporium tulheliwenetii TaxID=3383036 RepID=A0ACC2ZQ64_9PEZI|nr:hypothetical protein H2199_000421 [Cladosporium sp. JES 115]